MIAPVSPAQPITPVSDGDRDDRMRYGRAHGATGRRRALRPAGSCQREPMRAGPHAPPSRPSRGRRTPRCRRQRDHRQPAATIRRGGNQLSQSTARATAPAPRDPRGQPPAIPVMAQPAPAGRSAPGSRDPGAPPTMRRQRAAVEAGGGGDRRHRGRACPRLRGVCGVRRQRGRRALPVTLQVGALAWPCLHRSIRRGGWPELGPAVELVGQRVDAET